MREQTTRQRAAFCGISASARLVEQHQRRRRHLLQNIRDVAHVRRERGEALFERLCVANVSKDAAKTRQLVLILRWNQHAALRHKAEEPQGFESCRFSASIGSSNDEPGFSFGQQQINRDDRFASREEQRVTSVAESYFRSA